MSKGPRSQSLRQIPPLTGGPQRSRYVASVQDIWAKFSPDTLRDICQMPEEAFAEAFDMQTYTVEQDPPADFYAFKENGSTILAVAHLDTVSRAESRGCTFLDTEDGWVVHSPALDDRLGAYVILDLLPKLGMTFDILLTVGEETGQSTALFFEPGKKYDWVIEFDRGGTDVVMYQYDDQGTADLVIDSGARVGQGSFSDISCLEHLGVKAFNWGVGYQDYHSARSHAFLDDTFEMVAHFIEFFRVNKNVHLPHENTPDDVIDGQYISDILARDDAYFATTEEII
jgi:hypothetical protein